MILEKVLSVAEPLEAGGRKVERVVLPSADLARHRQRAKTDQGREIGISLPHGSVLRDCDVLYLDRELAIVVEQAPEELLRILPRTPAEFGLMGYQVGNLHRAAMVDARGIAVLYDKAVEALAHRFHVPVERVKEKFLPAQHSGHTHA